MSSERFRKKKIITWSIKKIQKYYSKSHKNKKGEILQNYFQENKNNLCKTWQDIKQIILIKKNNNKQLNGVKINNVIINGRKSIASKFSEFFGSVAKEIDKKIPKSKRTYTDYLKNRNLNSLLLIPVTESEIEKIINMFSEKKAVGPYSIPTNILKEYKKILSIPLALIINISFKRGIFPELCKIAHVIPVYKKGDQLDCSNYRLISLLSNISKVFEKAKYSRLYEFLNKYNCLCKKQFGFQNSHSTNHAWITEITEITEIIREALDRDEYSCGLLLDFQKAFDTVNHKILIGKLNHYGVRGLPLDWFKSYLTDSKKPQ